MSKEQILYSLDGKRYKVSPFALYWNNGNYYLYAYVSDKWYHTRSKKAEFSLEGYKEHLMEAYDDDGWEVPDPVSDFEDEVVENVDVQRFMATLSEKDRNILQLRQDGYTLQEIADKLEYKTHSAVLKRINKIGRQYEKYSGLSFGFQRMT